MPYGVTKAVNYWSKPHRIRTISDMLFEYHIAFWA